ncbi:MAG: hypothetical protein M1838_000114 [Thelocarpon superellum]|nr:MAG: hypothetical protein M1838_000114 [Thelocarpon superellum]
MIRGQFLPILALIAASSSLCSASPIAPQLGRRGGDDNSTCVSASFNLTAPDPGESFGFYQYLPTQQPQQPQQRPAQAKPPIIHDGLRKRRPQEAGTTTAVKATRLAAKHSAVLRREILACGIVAVVEASGRVAGVMASKIQNIPSWLTVEHILPVSMVWQFTWRYLPRDSGPSYSYKLRQDVPYKVSSRNEADVLLKWPSPPKDLREAPRANERRAHQGDPNRMSEFIQKASFGEDAGRVLQAYIEFLTVPYQRSAEMMGLYLAQQLGDPTVAQDFKDFAMGRLANAWRFFGGGEGWGGPQNQLHYVPCVGVHGASFVCRTASRRRLSSLPSLDGSNSIDTSGAEGDNGGDDDDDSEFDLSPQAEAQVEDITADYFPDWNVTAGNVTTTSNGTAAASSNATSYADLTDLES